MKILIYHSRVFRPMKEEDLDSLVVQAREFNGSHRITGLLFYQKRLFIQALECGYDEVDRLFRRIAKDKRPTEVMKLYHQKTTERNFPEWNMGFCRVSDSGSEFGELSGYSPVLRENFDPSSIDLKSEMTFNLVSLFKQYIRDDGRA